MESCLVKTEATYLEANPEETGSDAEHKEVPEEDVAVKPVGVLKMQHGYQNLVTERCQKSKKRTQGNVGSWKKLAAACRWITCHAIPAQHKEQCQDSVARGAPKGRMLQRTQQTCQEGSNGIRNRGVKEQLRLWKEKTTGNCIRERSRRQKLRLGSQKTLELENMKRVAKSSVRIRKMSGRTLWTGRPPPKEKMNLRRDGSVGTTATLGSSVHINWKMMVIHLDRLALYQGTVWNEWP
jgi:hypothetical protein